jgi:hypothetical protein
MSHHVVTHQKNTKKSSMQSQKVPANTTNPGKIKPMDMITGRIALKDTHKAGFMELIHNKDQHIKILVSPTLA